MTNLTSNGGQQDDEGGVICLSSVEDDFDDLLKNAPAPKVGSTVNLREVLAEKRHSYELAAEMSGFSLEKIKSTAVFELFVPLNPRPRVPFDITNTENNDSHQRSFARSPPKIAFHATPSLPSFSTAGIQPVPMSPSVNIFPSSNINVPTHSTPSVGVLGHSVTMTLTGRSRDQAEACRRNFAQNNQTMSLDTGTINSTVVIIGPGEEQPVDSLSPPPIQGGKGEKLNRTFTKADLILMKNNGVIEQTVTKFSAESDDESAESLSCGNPETMTSSSSAEQVPALAVPPASQSERKPVSRPASQLPGPAFSSRLMQPRVFSSTGGSNPSLVGSVSSLTSNNSAKPGAGGDNGDMLAPPGPLTRAGTFTKDSRATTGPTGQQQAPPKKSIGVVLPNKMSAPRPSVAPAGGQVKRNNTAGANLNAMGTAPVSGGSQQANQSMNVHAYRYPTANSSRPSTAGSLVRKSNAAK